MVSIKVFVLSQIILVFYPLISIVTYNHSLLCEKCVHSTAMFSQRQHFGTLSGHKRQISFLSKPK